MNNPFVYTDPSGEFPFIAAGIVAIFTYLRTAHANRNPETGKWDWNLSRTFSSEGRTPLVIGTNLNSDGEFGYNVNLGGQPIYDSRNENKSDPGANSVKGINIARNSEFYLRLNSGKAIIDHAINPVGSSSYYQMHGVSVDMRTGSLMFDNSTIGYDYMWRNSFYNENGKFGPAREVSGWDIKGGGTIVMPYYKNTIKGSLNTYQETFGNSAGLNVKFNGIWYPVETHTHTHPSYNRGEIGLSGSHLPDEIYGDYQFFRNTGLSFIQVIYNGKLYRVSYLTYKWKIEEIWTW